MDIKNLCDWLSKELVMEVTEKTIFLDDLGIAELEVDLFFIAFINKFEIEDVSALNINDYTLEDTNFFEIWFKGKRAKKFKVDHLLKVIEQKKWFDPNI